MSSFLMVILISSKSILDYFLYFSENNANGDILFLIHKMLRLIQATSSMIRTSLTTSLQFGYKNYDVKKVMTVKQRVRRYKNSYNLKRIYLIRPPDLRDPNIQFPIKIPMRIRHVKKNRDKHPFVDNTTKIKWNRLSPNEILLAFENLQYLTWGEVVEGLKYLSNIEGQQKHNWNQHLWVAKVFEYIRLNFNRIKKDQFLFFYYLMKKLNNTDQVLWKMIYQKIEEKIYDFYPSEFEKLFIRYYKISDQYFSPEMKNTFLKLMEGRLRQFNAQNILKVFDIFYEQKRITQFWKCNVFVPLFKSVNYNYQPVHMCRIFRNMMILGHEKDDRLYQTLYKRIMKYEFKNMDDIEMLEDMLGQVKELFISHRIQPYLTFLKESRQKLKENKVEKKLTLVEIVKQDVAFFMQKQQIEKQERAVL